MDDNSNFTFQFLFFFFFSHRISSMGRGEENEMKFYFIFVRLLCDIVFLKEKGEGERGGGYLFLQTMLRQICRKVNEICMFKIGPSLIL